MRTQDVRPGHRAKGVVATDQAGKGEEADARMTVQRKVGGGPHAYAWWHRCTAIHATGTVE